MLNTLVRISIVLEQGAVFGDDFLRGFEKNSYSAVALSNMEVFIVEHEHALEYFSGIFIFYTLLFSVHDIIIP